MHELSRTARLTGLFYLGLAVTGMLGFLIIRPRLFAAGDPAATLANLTGNEALARAGIVLELLIVVTQALAAVWFYRLFRDTDRFSALAIAAFGLINAVVILASSAMLATALQVALEPVGDAAAVVQVLYLTSAHLWGVGAVFFGLWLIPMGRAVLRSAAMPRALGWLLIASGVGYLLSALLSYAGLGVAADVAALPATVAEFWMIIYLLVWGVGRRAGAAVPAVAATA